MSHHSKVLLHTAIDLTAHQSWANLGYSVFKFYSDHDYPTFQKDTCALLVDLWKRAGLKPDEKFSPDQYHKLLNKSEDHIAAINQTRLLSVTEFPMGIVKLENRISEILGIPLRVLNPYDNQAVFHFRVIRPQSHDNNPLHRDVWLEDYDNCINLYIPIAGSNEQSSLTLIPGSHHWPENRSERTVSGAEINGMNFNVPAVTRINGDYEIIRPNPRENEVLIFSPYLLHGGATNLNSDQTRISIEIRLWKIS